MRSDTIEILSLLDYGPGYAIFGLVGYVLVTSNALNLIDANSIEYDLMSNKHRVFRDLMLTGIMLVINIIVIFSSGYLMRNLSEIISLIGVYFLLFFFLVAVGMQFMESVCPDRLSKELSTYAKQKYFEIVLMIILFVILISAGSIFSRVFEYDIENSAKEIFYLLVIILLSVISILSTILTRQFIQIMKYRRKQYLCNIDGQTWKIIKTTATDHLMMVSENDGTIRLVKIEDIDVLDFYAKE